MRTYDSKTGYVKSNVTGECFETERIYLGVNSKESDFEDITKEEYEAYVREQEARYAEYER